jgi:hypothetical protein
MLIDAAVIVAARLCHGSLAAILAVTNSASSVKSERIRANRVALQILIDDY